MRVKESGTRHLQAGLAPGCRQAVRQGKFKAAGTFNALQNADVLISLMVVQFELENSIFSV